MSAHTLLNQYWQLGRAALLPSPFLRVFCFFLVFLIISCGVFQLLEKPVASVIGVTAAFLLLMLIALQLPANMVALASSKPFALMADLRTTFFIIAFVISGLTALVICQFVYSVTPHNFSFLEILALSFTVLSFWMTTATFICAHNPPAMAFLPLLFVVFAPNYFESLAMAGHVEILALSLASVVIWCVFFVWWQRWRPAKYQPSLATLSFAETRRRLEEKNASTGQCASQPKTLSGSLLLGESDGISNRVKQEMLLPIAFLGLGLAFMLWMDITPALIPAPLVSAFTFILIVTRGCFLLERLQRHAYRLWMNTNYSRLEIFYRMEAFYFSAMLTHSASCILFIAGVNHFLFNNQVAPFLLSYLVLIALLCAAYSYYLGIVIYAKLTVNPLIISLMLLATYAGLLTGLVSFNLLWGWDISHHHQDYLLCSAGLLFITVLFRQWATSSWKRVSFCKVKN